MTPVLSVDSLTSDLDRALHYAMLWGLEGLELGTMGSAAERVPNIDEHKLRWRMREHNMPVEVVVPGLFQGAASERAIWMNDLLVLEETLEFCGRISCPRIMVSTFAEEPDNNGSHETIVRALQHAGKIAESSEVTICVLNEYGRGCSKGAELAQVLGDVAHPSVRAAWQPAAALEAGEDPSEGLEALGSDVALLRCSNRSKEKSGDSPPRSTASGGWRPAPLSAGAIDIPRQIEQLCNTGFDGPVSLVVDVGSDEAQELSEDNPSRITKGRYGLDAATWLVRTLHNFESR